MATLKQSTSYTRLFLLVESADHITGLTGATAAVTISKAGGAFASAGGTVTEVSSGWYKIALSTTDTGTLGDLAFHITATSADPTDFVDQVTANILGDTLPANATQLNGTALTARDIGASVLLSSGTGTGQVSLSSGTVTVGTNNDKTGYSLTQTFPTNFSALGISAGGHISNVDTLTTYTGNTVQTGDAYARLGAPAGASVSADIAAVKTDIDAGVTVAAIAAAAASLKKNTAFSHFEFLMTDSTNHNPMTGLTVTATHSIDGAAFASCTNAVAEVASGLYQINLSAADLNGNCITYRFTGTGADDRDVTVFTQP